MATTSNKRNQRLVMKVDRFRTSFLSLLLVLLINNLDSIAQADPPAPSAWSSSTATSTASSSSQITLTNKPSSAPTPGNSSILSTLGLASTTTTPAPSPIAALFGGGNKDSKSQDKSHDAGSTQKPSDGVANKFSQMVNNGTEKVNSTIHKVEDKVKKTFDDKIAKPLGLNNSTQSKNQTGSNVAAETFDKMHEISKVPLESVLKPIDKMLGVEKDPLLKIYDTSHDLLRKPLELMAKPVQSVFSGAFKTSDEVKDKKKEDKPKESKDKKQKDKKGESKTVLGQITDKTVELYVKPVEILFKPVDHALGLDKDGKKNPILSLIDQVYAISKKPVELLAEPFEKILKRMAEGDESYQLMVRVNNDDPKLITRLADGALSVADRMVTKPLEFVLKPFDHLLGLDKEGKKNPLIEAAHGLSNATKLGAELFTKPIDRIIKEVADLGDKEMDEEEREALFKRKRQEASLIVKTMDKWHELLQKPVEIVLKPVDKVLKLDKDGKKSPILRAWDFVHYIVRTPIQVLSKPWESFFNNEKPEEKEKKEKEKLEKLNQEVAKAASSGRKWAVLLDEKALAKHNASQQRHNVIIDNLKKVEVKLAKPLEVVSSPWRRLILGEDPKKGSKSSKEDKDKIMALLDRLNNAALEPFRLITQPVADAISHEQQAGDSKRKQSEQTKPPSNDKKPEAQKPQANGGSKPPSIVVQAQQQQQQQQSQQLHV